jgi:hypothetical protein
MIEVEQVVHQVQTGFGSDDVDKRIVPIVIIYKRKKSQWEWVMPVSAEVQPVRPVSAEVQPVRPMSVQPIILDAGRRTRRMIKALKRGRGRLMDEVEEVIQEYRARLSTDVENVQLVPLIMLYRTKVQRRSRPGLLGLLLRVFGQRR